MIKKNIKGAFLDKKLGYNITDYENIYSDYNFQYDLYEILIQKYYFVKIETFPII